MTGRMFENPRPHLVSVDLAGTLRREGFTLGDWRVEPLRHSIVHDEHGDRSLDPRLIDVLIALSARQGEVVTREELLAEVWRDTFVSENSLSQAVSRLRRALGDDRNRPRYIETIAKSGYRVVAEVRWKTPSRPRSVEPAPDRERLAPGPRWLPALLTGLAGVAMLVAAVRLGGTAPTDPRAATTVRPELTLVGSTFGPRISPDGAYVAFAWQGAAQDGNFDIWVQPTGGDAPVRLTDHAHPERLATWSPDGREVAFVRIDGPAGTLGLFRVPLIGGTAERIADVPTSIRSLDWSPDGRTMLFNTEEGLVALDLDDRSTRTLTSSGPDARDDAARFSPDGERVAFVRKHGPYRHDVMVMASAGGPVEALTGYAWGQIRGVSWNAQGDAVLFSSNHAGRFSLWSVALDGGSPDRIPIADPWVTQPDVARAGEPMIYRSFRDSVDLQELPVAEGVGEPVPRLSTSRSERQPAWSPDGMRIAFVSDRSGTEEIWSGDAGGSNLMRHTDFGGAIPSSPAWSPNGTTLAFDVPVDGHTDVWVVDADSRRPVRRIEGAGEERNPTFSRDGRSIYFASDRSGDWEIWRAPVDGGEARVVTEGGGFAAAESLDGGTLYFSRVAEPGLWRMPVEGGPAELVVDGLTLFDWGSWAVAEGGVYYLRRGPTRIEFLGFDGAEPRIVYQPPKQMPYLGRALSYSPARGSLVFSIIDHSDDEVMTVR